MLATTLLLPRGVFHHPIHVLIAGRYDIQIENLAYGRRRPRILPFVDLGMSIDERNPARAAVVTAELALLVEVVGIFAQC